MSTHTYTENHLVEQPAIGLFAELGRQTVSAMICVRMIYLI
jgi:type I restriction enzyme R subunit